MTQPKEEQKLCLRSLTENMDDFGILRSHLIWKTFCAQWISQACTTPTVRDICTFAVFFLFSVFQPLFASHVFLKVT